MSQEGSWDTEFAKCNWVITVTSQKAMFVNITVVCSGGKIWGCLRALLHRALFLCSVALPRGAVNWIQLI